MQGREGGLGARKSPSPLSRDTPGVPAQLATWGGSSFGQRDPLRGQRAAYSPLVPLAATPSAPSGWQRPLPSQPLLPIPPRNPGNGMQMLIGNRRAGETLGVCSEAPR